MTGAPALSAARPKSAPRTRCGPGAAGRAARPACVGAGLVVLDAIYGARGAGPGFLVGGSCANVLTILSYLGWDSYPAARLGRDPEGRRVIEDMESWGVHTEFLRTEARLDTPRIVERAPGGGRAHGFSFRCSHGRRLPRRRPYTLGAAGEALARLPAAGVFYFDRADPGALKIALRMKAGGAAVFFEPHKTSGGAVFERCLRAADVVKSCGAAAGPRPPLEVQTLGAGGLRYRARGTGWARMRAFPVGDLADAAGSGDWLSAGLIHSMFGGGSPAIPARRGIERALRFGSALAAANCGFVGGRGMMYSMARGRALALAERIASGRKAVHVGDGALRAGRAPGCRVCLCGAAGARG